MSIPNAQGCHWPLIWEKKLRVESSLPVCQWGRPKVFGAKTTKENKKGLRLLVWDHLQDTVEGENNGRGKRQNQVGGGADVCRLPSVGACVLHAVQASETVWKTMGNSFVEMCVICDRQKQASGNSTWSVTPAVFRRACL